MRWGRRLKHLGTMGALTDQNRERVHPLHGSLAGEMERILKIAVNQGNACGLPAVGNPTNAYGLVRREMEIAGR